MLLNTSFNENEPIVRSPYEAIECLLRTNMDALFINNFFIKKNKMIANFLIDSRYGGPHLYLHSLKKKKIYKEKSFDYYQDKPNRNLKLIDLKRYNKFFFLIDIFVNTFIIYFNFYRIKKIKSFCVFTIYNIAPIIAAFF